MLQYHVSILVRVQADMHVWSVSRHACGVCCYIGRWETNGWQKENRSQWNNQHCASGQYKLLNFPTTDSLASRAE